MKRKRTGGEDLLHKTFAQIIAKYEFYKKTNPSLVWTYIASGEKRSAVTGALLKAKGVKRGFPDFFFKLIKNNITHNIWFEFKFGKNKQTPEQIEFEKRCNQSKNEAYYLVDSVEKAIKLCFEEEILNS